MKTEFNVNQIASFIADIMRQNIGITIARNNEDSKLLDITVTNGNNDDAVTLTFLNPSLSHKVNAPALTGKPADEKPAHEVKPVTSIPDKGTPTVKTIALKKKNSRWWSRFNFEKNIMKMTLFALQERYPYEQSYSQQMFAERLAKMMSWHISTAKRHITQAAKMGIIDRVIIDTTYHITGMNDIDLETAKEEVADREQELELFHPSLADFLDGENPADELKLNKTVDETILP